jgi:hypothetical protein
MWLLLRLVLEFLGRSAAWLAAVAALAGVVALGLAPVARRPLRRVYPGTAAGALLGGLLGASLWYRFSWPEVLIVEVWRRSLPLAWTTGGSLVGAGMAILILRRRSAASAS